MEPLDLKLRRRKVETIVLCGVSTNIGVETTGQRCISKRVQSNLRE